MDLQQIKEKYCKENGWNKQKGYRIEMNKGFGEDYDYFFIEKEFVSECEYWIDNIGNQEVAFDNEDIDELIEHIDDYKEEDETIFEQYLKKLEETSHTSEGKD